MIDHIYPEILQNLTTTDYENITSIYLTGIASTFYALLGIYLIITYMKETNLEIKKMLMILVDIFVILLLSGLFMTILPETINNIKTSTTDYKNTVLLLSIVKTLISYTIIGFILHYTFRTIQSFDMENNTLSKDINQLYKFTYIYILVALGFIVFENGIIFLLRDLTDETNFVMDIPLLTMIFAGLLLLISKYIKESNLIKEDNELII
jgi:low temperature requirement protein LtrA